MSLADDEDLSPFFADFVTTATLGGSEIPIIFDSYHDDLELQAEGRRITALVRTETLPTTSHGDTITIGATTYEIVGIRPTDDGKITYLDLKET